MRSVTLTLIFIAQVAAQSTELYLYENEIWIGNPPHLEQITHDKAGKSSVTFSPAKNAVAYVEDCGNAAKSGCSPRLVFRDLKGNPLYSFLPLRHSDGRACLSVLQFDWIDTDRIGFSCHVSPSLSEYSVMSISKAASIAGYSGGPFEWSTDRKQLAYGGPVLHFSPPYAQSFYLCLGDRLLYPRVSSLKNCLSGGNPNKVELKGSTYFGIRDLSSDLLWRPDGSAIAFVERVYDWAAPEPSALSGGSEIERGHELVVVPLNGPAVRSSLRLEKRGYPTLTWTGPSTLEVREGAQKPRVFHVEPSGLSPR